MHRQPVLLLFLSGLSTGWGLGGRDMDRRGNLDFGGAEEEIQKKHLGNIYGKLDILLRRSVRPAVLRRLTRQ